MAKTLFKVFMNLLLSLASLITGPINAMIANDFPDFSTQMGNLATYINTYLGNSLAYFFHILPNGVSLYLSWIIDSLIVLIILSISAHIIVKVIGLIKRVKVI